MKKNIKSFISVTMIILILATNGVNVNGYTQQNFSHVKNNAFLEDTVSRQEVVDIYMNLLETTNNQKPNKQLYRSMNSDTLFTGDFAILEQLAIEDETSRDTAYMKNESDMFANITYNKNSGMYTLIEVNEHSDDILLMVEEEEFRIVQEVDGSINIYSKNNNVLPVMEVTDDTGAKFREQILSDEFSSLYRLETIKENDYQLNSSYIFGPYGNKTGPFRTTNKVWVDVLTILGFVGGGTSIKVDHPVLGIILLVVGISVWVGDKISQTFYLEYYQSFSLSPTYYYKYALVESDWYQYYDYTGYVGQTKEEKRIR